MLLSLLESADRISDPSDLDATVEEVFAVVMGCACAPIAEAKIIEEISLMSVVGFGGILSGACVFRCGAQAALTIAGRMMNATLTELDTTVQDAIGEICNMLAGGWKGRIPELAAACSLSLPTVITGRDYRFRIHNPQFQLCRFYCFDNLQFEVLIVCEGLS